MNIKILYDNQAKEGFCSGWGFSALIDGDTLFDTGEDPASLLANMQAFGIRPDGIKHVVLSHEDGDHTGGIALLKRCNRINVFVPGGASRSLKEDITRLNPDASVVEAMCATTIDSNKFVTATLGVRKREISLAVRTNRGLVLVTGCAHPGLGKIMEKTGECGRIHAVIGGFHGFNKLHALHDIEMIVPCHCTKRVDAINVLYPKQTFAAFAGAEFDIE